MSARDPEHSRHPELVEGHKLVEGRELILDPREFRLLDGLRLNPRKSAPGRVRGERLSRRKGISIEFADFRDYVEGDDLRHLDWNVLARLETPIIKTYQDEEDLAVHLLLDCSASMEFGTPRKLDAARRFACAIGYVALCGTDAVFPFALGARQAPLAAVRGRAGYHRLAAWACGTGVPPVDAEHGRDARATLAEAIREFSLTSARAGLAVVLSDGLDPAIAPALRKLAGRGHEIAFVQVLSREELDPDLEGDLRLLDCETGAAVEVTAHGHALKEYRRRLDVHCASIAEECRRVGGRYVQAVAGEPLEEFVRDKLKRQGWVTS